MNPDLRRLLILIAALAPLTPGTAAAAAAAAQASATVLPLAAVQPLIVVDVRPNGSSGQVLVSAASANPRSDGASLSASLTSATDANPASSTPIALAPTSGSAANASGLLGARLATSLPQAELAQNGQLSITVNYN